MLVTRYASTWDERLLAHKFVANRYKDSGYIPDPTHLQEMPHFQVTVANKKRIVGSIGLYIYKSNENLPIDFFFSFENGSTVAEVVGLDRDLVVEVSRLTSIAGFSCSAALFVALSQFMVSTGRQDGFFVASVSPMLFAILRDKYGFPVHQLPARVKREAVPVAYHNYFLPADPSKAPVVMLLQASGLQKVTDLFIRDPSLDFVPLPLVEPPAIPENLYAPWKKVNQTS